MATYRIDDNTIVNTAKALAHWDEERDWDGNNHCGRMSHSQWHDQTLYHSAKGRYYLVTCTRVQGEQDGAQWCTFKEAAAWLLENGDDLPEELEVYREEIEE